MHVLSGTGVTRTHEHLKNVSLMATYFSITVPIAARKDGRVGMSPQQFPILRLDTESNALVVRSSKPLVK